MRRALVLIALLAGGCGRPAPGGPFVLRLGCTLPLEWRGPKTLSGGAMLATDMIYETVLAPSGDQLVSPFLRRWELMADGAWRLEFRAGRRFSDGRPVTAEDVARSLRVQDLEVTRQGDTLLARSPKGLAALLLAPVTDGDGVEALGTGPFALVERSERRLVLRRVEPLPGRIARVELVGFASTREAFAHLLRGEVNAITPVDRGQAELVAGVPGLQVVSGRAPNAIAAFLNPRTLSREARIALAESLPVAEIASRAGLGAHCEAPPPRRAVPAGRPLRVAHLDLWEENRRAALALRRALGTRAGGDIVSVHESDGNLSGGDFDILVKPALVWPSVMLATTLASGARFNSFGYANPVFDAAALRSDDAAAAAALREDPPMIVLCRRERFMAVDARLRGVEVSEWGVLDRVQDWEVAP